MRYHLPYLQLKRFVVIRNDKDVVYDEAFHTGLNILSGDNSSGKSTLLNLIYYGLGGDLDKWSQAALLCRKTLAELDLSGNMITVASDISENTASPMELFVGAMGDALEAPSAEWKRYPYRRSASLESFSQVLFRFMGMPEVALETSGNITMHQILRLLYADQLSPIDDIFRFERFEPSNMRDTVGRLLCGAYNNDLYEKKRN